MGKEIKSTYKDVKIEERESIIPFLNYKNMKIIQRNDFFNFSIDSILISHFLTVNKGRKKIIDLGSGNGVIPMLLSRRTTAKITGVEIQDVSVELAKKNIVLNGLESQVDIIKGDIKKLDSIYKNHTFDAVITNPPFFKYTGENTLLNNLDQLTYARHEILINLEEIIKESSRLLKFRGYFAMVHRADRLADILVLMKKYKIEPKRLQFCHPTKTKTAKILLIEGLKGAESGLLIDLPLYINNNDGTYTEEIVKMFGDKI